MKVQIPDALKAGMPQTTFGKILSATPVIMAVLATMLAGLSSSETTRAQYARSLGAQQQSKAADQWGFFQAKRLRGALQRNTVDLMATTAMVRPFDPAGLKTAADQVTGPQADEFKTRLNTLLSSPPGQQTTALLQKDEIPPPPPAPALDPNITKAEDAVEDGRTDEEVAALLAGITAQTLENDIRSARDRAKAFDELTRPVNETLDSLQALLSKNAALLHAGAGTESSLMRDFAAARLRFAAQRYDTEARLNQSIASLYELQVRKTNSTSERHRIRGQRFFFGMLGAQAGVIISTLAMAARNRNLLWSLAAAAGLLALAFAIYVYLYV